MRHSVWWNKKKKLWVEWPIGDFKETWMDLKMDEDRIDMPKLELYASSEER